MQGGIFISWSTIQYKQKSNGVSWIILNRPEARNAMSALMFDELNQLLLQLGKDVSTRSILLTGEGKAFCAGGDLTEMKAGYGGNAGFYRHMENANQCIATLLEIDKPVVAAVNGAATGAGMNLALAADIAIAAENAKFSEIFGNVGLIPDLGGTWLLPRLVGRAKAKELLFSYRMIGADVYYTTQENEFSSNLGNYVEDYTALVHVLYRLNGAGYHCLKYIKRNYRKVRALLDQKYETFQELQDGLAR
ncbi:enoyl-CoA hydratase/isomerase family protein [Evtepia sp.]|uniref:enoyl-CoA hydratase/isomerase family protein n=1 Tax=Evtepia sp. TaxID=2773933 RepID=UPI003990A2CE